MYNSIITNDIQYIFQVFNYMSMTDFASLLGINRSTTYSYLEFSKCYNLSAKKNLEKLVEIAELFDKANIKRLDSFMHREIINSKTLFEIIQDNICSPIIDLDKVILIVKEIADKEVATRKRDRCNNKPLRSLEQVLNEYSTPISYD
jgi:hypothetical protein